MERTLKKEKKKLMDLVKKTLQKDIKKSMDIAMMI